MSSAVGKAAISVAFVRPSVCSSVAYTANNSRTKKPSLAKFGMNISHLRCDSHTSFKIKRSKVRVTDGRGHTVSAEPGGHTACLPPTNEEVHVFARVCLFVRLSVRKIILKHVHGFG